MDKIFKSLEIYLNDKKATQSKRNKNDCLAELQYLLQC